MQVLLLGQTDPGLKQRMCPVILRGQVCFWWFWCLQKLICLWLMLLLYCAPPAETLYDRAWHSFSLLCISMAKKHSWWEIQGLDHAEKNGTRHVFFTNLCDRTGTRGQAGSDRRRRKQPCFREGGMKRRGEQWGNKAQSRLQLGHLRGQNSWQLPLCRILSNRLASLLQKT